MMEDGRWEDIELELIMGKGLSLENLPKKIEVMVTSVMEDGKLYMPSSYKRQDVEWMVSGSRGGKKSKYQYKEIMWIFVGDKQANKVKMVQFLNMDLPWFDIRSCGGYEVVSMRTWKDFGKMCGIGVMKTQDKGGRVIWVVYKTLIYYDEYFGGEEDESKDSLYYEVYASEDLEGLLEYFVHKSLSVRYKLRNIGYMIKLKREEDEDEM
jgi:hypothetical protein